MPPITDFDLDQVAYAFDSGNLELLQTIPLASSRPCSDTFLSGVDGAVSREQ
jgi:hypothetical protein